MEENITISLQEWSELKAQFAIMKDNLKKIAELDSKVMLLSRNNTPFEIRLNAALSLATAYAKLALHKTKDAQS